MSVLCLGVMTHGDTYPNWEHSDMLTPAPADHGPVQLVLARMRLSATLTTGTSLKGQFSHTLTTHVNFRCTIQTPLNIF